MNLFEYLFIVSIFQNMIVIYIRVDLFYIKLYIISALFKSIFGLSMINDVTNYNKILLRLITKS